MEILLAEDVTEDIFNAKEKIVLQVGIIAVYCKGACGGVPEGGSRQLLQRTAPEVPSINKTRPLVLELQHSIARQTSSQKILRTLLSIIMRFAVLALAQIVAAQVPTVCLSSCLFSMLEVTRLSQISPDLL